MSYAAAVSCTRTISRDSIQCEPSPCVCKASASRVLRNHRFIKEASIHSQIKRRSPEAWVPSFRTILICFMVAPSIEASLWNFCDTAHMMRGNLHHESIQFLPRTCFSQ